MREEGRGGETKEEKEEGREAGGREFGNTNYLLLYRLLKLKCGSGGNTYG